MAHNKVAQKSSGNSLKRIPARELKAAKVFVALAALEGRKITPQQAYAELQKEAAERDVKARAEEKMKARLNATCTRECARENLQEALQSLAVVRDLTQAMQDGEEFAGYLPERDLARLMRLSLVEAGTTIERALEDLGILPVAEMPHFIDRPVSAAQ